MIVKLFGLIREDKRNLIILILILVAVLLRCVIFVADWETIVRLVPDDPFYYFQLASNIISGHGSSMDGIHLTNGYHPLWPVIISPFFLLKPIDPIIPVKLALFFSSLLTVISAFAFYKLINHITNNKAIGIIAFTVYVFNYYIIIVESIGEPAGISNLLIVLLLYLTWQYANGTVFGNKQAILFGLIGGFSMLARTDNAIFFSMFFIFGLVWFRPFRLSKYILAASMSLLILLPWFIWNLATFGTIVQSSAFACSYITYMNSDTTMLARLLSSESNSPTALISVSISITRFGYLNYLFYIVIGLGISVLTSKNRLIRRGIILALSGLLVSYILLFLHYSVVWYFRDWHVAAAAPFVLMIIILTIKHYIDICPKLTWLWKAYVFIFLFISVFLLFKFPSNKDYYHQLDIIDAKDWVLQQPKGTVAIYDGGIMQYMTDGWALSIDGNVNNSANQAVIDSRVLDYMKANGVKYLVGWEWIIKRYRKFWPGAIEDELSEIKMPPTRATTFIMSRPNYFTGVFRFWKIKEPK